MRVAVLPTGHTEWHGLPAALGALFPAHTFFPLPGPTEMTSDPGVLRGFTAVRLGAEHEADPPEFALDLIGRAAQAALGSITLPPAELVLILDDLELANADQPERVVAVLRRAVEVHLQGLPPAFRGTTQEALRRRVSFHLVAPMIEAWFFADRRALRAAGVPPGTAVHLRNEVDPEHFETADPGYLAATEASCPAWCGLRSHDRKSRRPKWLGTDRQHHPKGYLQWLCLEGSSPGCTSYSPVVGGLNALRALSWQALLNRSPAHMAFTRAMIMDLASVLGAPAADLRPGLEAPPTSLRSPRLQPVLRNV